MIHTIELNKSGINESCHGINFYHLDEDNLTITIVGSSDLIDNVSVFYYYDENEKLELKKHTMSCGFGFSILKKNFVRVERRY
jgi:hypothetical protein